MDKTIAPASQAPVAQQGVTITLMEKLLAEKKTAREFQERKHIDWNENYELYRNRVRTNRLTQRQAVNIPLMKETVKTLLSKIDDSPNVDWKERSGDEIKELVYQEIWNQNFKTKKFEWVDVLDKKNVLLYGVSAKKLNLGDNCVTVDVLDPYDVLFDPMMSPLDIETARFIIHRNIYRSLRDILADSRYTEEGKDALRIWVTTDRGVVQTSQNAEAVKKKQERLIAMGVNSSYFANFAGGDVMVNLTEHYTLAWNTDKKEFERRVIVYAEDQMALLDDKLEDLIGMTEWPFTLWSEDIETNDVYPDGIADLVRTPNKVVNVWYSQYIENRSLANMGMHWYDATVQGYQPQTYEPGQGRMLPAPGDPNKTIMPVQFESLQGTLEAIQFLTAIVERSSGATAIEKGTPESGVQTLGEVEILVGKAGERAISMNKFYRASWYETAIKWDKMMQHNSFDKFTLYKTGRSGKVYEKIVYDKEWKSEAGYEPDVSSTSEQEQNQLKNLQKYQYVISQFPNNSVLRRIMQSRELEMLDLTPQELKEVEEEEKKLAEASMMGMGPGARGGASAVPAGMPAPPPIEAPVMA